MARYLSGTLPFTFVGDKGDSVSLRTLLEQAYGAETVAALGNIELSYTSQKPYWDASYWDPTHPSFTYILQNGKILEQDDTITISGMDGIDGITFSAGNMIYANVSISFQTGADTYQEMALKTVPTALGEPGSFNRVVTARDIVDSAHRLAKTFGGVPNDNDCYYIADTIASAAGAPLPLDSYWSNPAENVEGGYWRIVHKGTDNPVENWQNLLRAGDIVRLEWADNSGPHSFTVTSDYNTTGRMEVVDNADNDTINQHWVEYESQADPASITIYRIAPDGLFLINGSAVAETLYGTERSDDLRGLKGADTLIGGRGDDKIDGGHGADRMIGGFGNDVFLVDNAGDLTIEAAREGYDRVLTTVSYTLAAGQSIEELAAARPGHTAPLNLIGNDVNQDIRGNAGNNVIDGRGGIDQLYGLAGDDTYAVDTMADRVFESVGNGYDTVVASVSYTLTAGQEIERLQLASKTGKASLDVTGNGFDNALFGNNGDNVLDGKGGVDTLVGKAGNDTYGVDNAQDLVFEAQGAGYDKVVASVSYTLEAGQEIEQLQLASRTAKASLDLTGNAFANAVFGNNGSNVLDGKAGADTLTGKGGADTFAFSTSLGAGNIDRITDFSSEDTIRLAREIFTGLAPGELGAGAFKQIGAGGAAIDATDRILYDQGKGALFYDADGSGTAQALQFAALDNRASLTHADFFVV